MYIELKDGSKLEFSSQISCFDVAKTISEGLARNALVAKVDGELVDLNFVLKKDSKLEIITFKDEEGKKVYRHTCAHILAQAVKSVFPTSKLAIGPSIDTGFYYDFDFKNPISEDDLDKIEAEMNRIIKADFPLERMVVTKREAIEVMTKFNEIYKIELINDLPKDEKITFYRQGSFVDLCKGPHLLSTGKIKAFKLTQIAGAYWRGNEKNKMLTRIYGTAFDKKSDLTEYLEALEEAKRRDHNKLGRELNIFMTDENVGQGLPLLMPKGAKIIQILQRFVEDEEERRGYLLTKTPSMSKNNLFKISGHWDHYKDKMFVIGEEGVDDEVLALRPMTCPFQFSIYKKDLHSYRDLPIRYNETASEFRKEASGEMHGLIRIRQFTLADGHIVCTPSQIEQEFAGALDLVYYLLEVLKLKDEVSFRFSKWDENDKEKYIGSKDDWEKTQAEMKKILDDIGVKYTEADGEAAFYGPKLDIQGKNVYGKEDTLFTIQIDFALAERFDMTYVDADGVKKRPMIIHRSSIGCYERTLAMLIEKYAGNFPLWLSPTQVKVLSLTDRTIDKVNEVADALRYAGLRVEKDIRAEKVGYKIREAQLEKIPYMVIIGDKEAENNMLSVRSRNEGDLGAMELNAFIEKLKKENDEKA